MAGPQNSAVKARDLPCHNCGSILGVISPDGVIEQVPADQETCDTCKPFEILYENVKSSEQTWIAMEPRRSNFGGRVEALTKHREARKELANFLLQLERNDPPNDNQTPVQESCENDPAQEQEIAQQSPPRTPKRPRGPTSIPASDQSTLLKRPRLSNSRRVTFDPATVFRGETEHRSTDEYHRDTEGYVRGRNAAPEDDQYLDTSGHMLEYRVFHRLKWDKKRRQWDHEADQDPVVQDPQLPGEQDDRPATPVREGGHSSST